MLAAVHRTRTTVWVLGMSFWRPLCTGRPSEPLSVRCALLMCQPQRLVDNAVLHDDSLELRASASILPHALDVQLHLVFMQIICAILPLSSIPASHVFLVDDEQRHLLRMPVKLADCLVLCDETFHRVLNTGHFQRNSHQQQLACNLVLHKRMTTR